MQSSANIAHPNVLKKLNAYLAARKRQVPELKGICNGASLMLLTYVYEAMNEYYKDPENQNLSQKIKEGVARYFERIESIANIPDIPDSEIKDKWRLMETKNWYEANQTLQHAIANKSLNVTLIAKSIPHYEAILKLADEQNILSKMEIELLNAAHIQDIPEYEYFLNEIILLQSSSQYLYDISQTDFPKLFPILQKNDTVPSPIEEEGASFVLTPLDLAANVSFIFPENKLILMHLPDHSTAVIRSGNEYQFYDINNKEKLLFTDVPEIIVCLLAKHQLDLQMKKLNFFNDTEKYFQLKVQISQIEKLQQEIIAKSDSKKRLMLIAMNEKILPPTLGFCLSIYSHQNALPLNKKWQQVMLDIQDEGLNLCDTEGETALWKACAAGQLKFVQLLIARGASFNTKRYDGATAFYIACQNGHIEIMELFQSKGVDINITNDNGRTALYSCALSGNYQSAKWLLDHGAKTEIGVKSKNDDEILTPLVIASASGHADIVQLLIEYGAEKKINVLFQAVIFNQPEVIRILAKNGFDMNAGDSSGMTPLMHAALHGKVESMQVLIDLGAEVNVVTKDGKTAFLAAVDNGSLTAIELLSRYGANTNVTSEGRNALHDACLKGNTIIVEHLLGMGFDPNQLSEDGLTPLMFASYQGHVDIMNLLLNHPAINPDITSTQGSIMSALHLAIQQDKGDAVVQLCKAGANVNLQNVDDDTALDMAIESGKAEIAFVLLQYGGICHFTPEKYKLPKNNINQSGITIIKLDLDQDQKCLNTFINECPSMFIKGNTLAEKIGLIFKDMMSGSADLKLFDEKKSITNKNALIIRDILLDPDNKNWSHEQIQKCLEEYKPDTQNEDVKMAVLLTKYFLSKVVETQTSTDQLSPVFKMF